MKPFFRRSGLVGLLGATALAAGQAQAAATILLWPIDPWLSAEARATELWIQNQGNSATTMQVRIVRWKQEGGYERYTAQQDVVASPPIVTIAKGSKQLIRLIKHTNETAKSFSEMSEHEKAAAVHEKANNGQSSVVHQQQADKHRSQITQN